MKQNLKLCFKKTSLDKGDGKNGKISAWKTEKTDRL